MYSKQHRNTKNSANSSDKSAPSQFAPRGFVVQPKTEEVTPQKEQTPKSESQREEAKQYKSAFIDDSKFTPRSSPAVTPRVQMKLTIGEPGDQYEQEADRMAAGVVQRINAPQNESVQRVEMPEDEDKLQSPSMVQRFSVEGGTAATPDIEESIQRAKGGGQPLGESIREPMEQAFGADFSGVKVHTDSQSDQLNQSIQAKAFTTGQDVFFRQGAYEPGSRGGQELLAHELTHVVQQNGSGNLQRQDQENNQQQTNFEPLSQTIKARATSANLISRVADPIVEATKAKGYADETVKNLGTAIQKTKEAITAANTAINADKGTDAKQAAETAKTAAKEVADLKTKAEAAELDTKTAANEAKNNAAKDFDPEAKTNEVKKAKAAIDADADAKFVTTAKEAIASAGDAAKKAADAAETVAIAKQDVETNVQNEADLQIKAAQMAKDLTTANEKLSEATASANMASTLAQNAHQDALQAKKAAEQESKNLVEAQKIVQEKQQEADEAKKNAATATQTAEKAKEVAEDAARLADTLKQVAQNLAQQVVAKELESKKLATTATSSQDEEKNEVEKLAAVENLAKADNDTASNAQIKAKAAADVAAEAAATAAKLADELFKISINEDAADYLAAARFSAQQKAEVAAQAAQEAANLAKVANNSQEKVKAAKIAADKAKEGAAIAIQAANEAQKIAEEVAKNAADAKDKAETAAKDQVTTDQNVLLLVEAAHKLEEAAQTAAKAVIESQKVATTQEQNTINTEKIATNQAETAKKQQQEADQKANIEALSLADANKANQAATEATQKAKLAAESLQKAKDALNQATLQAKITVPKAEDDTKKAKETEEAITTGRDSTKETKDIKDDKVKAIRQDQNLLKLAGGQTQLDELLLKVPDPDKQDKLETMLNVMGYNLLKECLVTKNLPVSFLHPLSQEAGFKAALSNIKVPTGTWTNPKTADVLEAANTKTVDKPQIVRLLTLSQMKNCLADNAKKFINKAAGSGYTWSDILDQVAKFINAGHAQPAGGTNDNGGGDVFSINYPVLANRYAATFGNHPAYTLKIVLRQNKLTHFKDGHSYTGFWFDLNNCHRYGGVSSMWAPATNIANITQAIVAAGLNPKANNAAWGNPNTQDVAANYTIAFKSLGTVGNTYTVGVSQLYPKAANLHHDLQGTAAEAIGQLFGHII